MLDPKRPFFFWAGIIEPHEPSGPTNYKLLEKEFGVTLDQVSLPPFMEDTEVNRRERANFVYEICRADTHLARMLKDAGMNYPVSLHCEYDLGGAEKGKKDPTMPRKQILATIKQDVDTIKRIWGEA